MYVQFLESGKDIKMKNDKKHILKFFGINLLKSLLSICVLLLVGFVSYKISYYFLSKDAVQQQKKAEQDTLEEIKQEAQVDEISKNLIYVCDENNKITHMMVEICNTKTYNMDYITIPTKNDYTIPTTMYRKLCTINDEIPQIIRLNKMKQYFENEDDAYGYGLLIVQKMIGTELSYYTVLDTETYESFCQEVKVKVSYKKTETAEETSSPSPEPTEDPETGATPKPVKTSKNAKTKMNISIASTEFTTQLNDIKGDQNKIKDFIEELYDRVNSNLTVYNKWGYLDCYEKMDVNLFHYWGIPGAYNGDKVFEVDTKAAKSFLKELIGNETTYTEVQDLTTTQKAVASPSPSPTAEPKQKKTKKTTKAVSSKGLQILILNGSRINGLAGKMQEKLQKKGYTIAEIGDYTKETLTKTKIIVKKEGQGEDLAKYFKNPTVTVGMVEEGYDIEIIVGTADANK